MPKENHIEVLKASKGPTLRIFSKGRWYYLPLSLRNETPKPIKGLVNTRRALALQEIEVSGVDISTGGPDEANAVPLALNTKISLCNVDAALSHFILKDGEVGQVKYVIYNSEENVSDKMTLYAHTKFFADVYSKFIVLTPPRTLAMIFDGTNWHPLGTLQDALAQEWTVTTT